MALVPYTITAIERDVADAAVSGKQVRVGASCSMFIQPANTAVIMYNNDAAGGGNAVKVTGANGQVVVYVESGEYRVSVDGFDSFKTISADDSTLGTASTFDVTTSTTDTTASRLTKVNDFGIGGQGVQKTDFNDCNTFGGFSLFSGALNPPRSGAINWSCFVIVAQNGNNLTQYATEVSNNTRRTYIRTRSGGAFTAWDEVFTNGNANFNLFKANGIQDIIATGAMLTGTVARVYLPLNGVSAPSSITVTGSPNTFDVYIDNALSATSITVTMQAGSNSKLAVFNLTGGGLSSTTGKFIELRSASALSSITVNF
tara:strand:+ start:100 stop:1044 length:945 start_codon:yes stop_codon:yes gene_type:complete